MSVGDSLCKMVGLDEGVDVGNDVVGKGVGGSVARDAVGTKVGKGVSGSVGASVEGESVVGASVLTGEALGELVVGENVLTGGAVGAFVRGMLMSSMGGACRPGHGLVKLWIQDISRSSRDESCSGCRGGGGGGSTCAATFLRNRFTSTTDSCCA